MKTSSGLVCTNTFLDEGLESAVECSHCHSEIEIPATEAGMVFRCPICKNKQEIPHTEVSALVQILGEIRIVKVLLFAAVILLVATLLFGVRIVVY